MSEFFSTPIQGLDYMTFFSIVDQSYDELLIYDDNYNIVYINQACSRHYGCSSAEMIGKNFYDLVSEDWWNPSLLPIVYKEKKPFAQQQMTRVGAELLTIAVPVFDDKQKLRFVVMLTNIPSRWSASGIRNETMPVLTESRISST